MKTLEQVMLETTRKYAGSAVLGKSALHPEVDGVWQIIAIENPEPIAVCKLRDGTTARFPMRELADMVEVCAEVATSPEEIQLRK